MKNSLTAQDVLTDIEFELLQGAISRDDLGQGIQSVKKYQNKMRTDILQPGQKTPELREILGKQFQVNDMLITMLQEVVANQQAQDLTLKRFNAYRSNHPELIEDMDRAMEMTRGQVKPYDSAVSEVVAERDTKDIQNALDETLGIQPDVQPSSIPIIGAFIQRAKHAFHMMVIFYLQKLAQKQTAVNQTYGDWLLYLNTVNQHQEQELNQLRQELIATQNQPDSGSTKES